MPTDSFWKTAFKCSHLQNKVEGISVGLRSEGQTDGPSGYIVANLPTCYRGLCPTQTPRAFLGHLLYALGQREVGFISSTPQWPPVGVTYCSP